MNGSLLGLEAVCLAIVATYVVWEGLRTTDKRGFATELGLIGRGHGTVELAVVEG